ncbi:AAA family ATPase, partial [Candidatus Azambacteria bacterium]|nr:AAA family ATPase [Candidatus Azambacteria bacterium]
ASMVDLPLGAALMKALPSNAALVILGDVDQLPSVGPGKFLSDLIQANSIPVVRLTEVFRQAAQSHIIQVAHQINCGQIPLLKFEGDSDFYFIEIDIILIKSWAPIGAQPKLN